MLIKEVTAAYKLNKLNIKKDDPRYDLYKPTIEKYTDYASDISNLLHNIYHNKKFGGYELNSFLYNRDEALMLDDIMYNHYIKRDITVYHGLQESPLRIWLKYKVPFDQPVTVHFPSYISTSTDLYVAGEFTRTDSDLRKSLLNKPVYKNLLNLVRKDNVLVLKVPAGTPGLSVREFSKLPEEDEILLARGLNITIQPNPTIKNSFAYWNAEVVGHTPREIAE
jgi:hypothetical protein